MSTIHFTATLHDAEITTKIGSGALLTLPKTASGKLPSRGMVNVTGTMNGHRFRVVLQPDGQGSHWLKVNKAMREAVRVDIGDSVTLEIEPSKVWTEPDIPKDLKEVLAADPQALARWMDITPMARWEWLNWMGSVKLPQTLRERPEKLCSMLKAGKRRPCCFNRSLMMPPKAAEPL